MKSKQKIGLLTIEMESGWRSCVSISANLVKAYEALARGHGFKVQRFGILPRAESEVLAFGSRYFFDLAAEVHASGVTDFVFIDHHIDPVAILTAMRLHDPRWFKTLRFTFHVYGDFTLTTYRWVAIGKMLAGMKVKYLCASERQIRMVSFFLPPGSTACALCPFPINENVYRYSPRARLKVRKRLGITQKQTILLYTGRMSLQKGIVALIEQFERLKPVANDYVLVLAGPYDDLGGMTSGIRLPPGFYFHHLRARMQKLPEAVRRRILFAGDLEVQDLKDIYSAADLFVSLSLHHDEDYGMCPAEALATGLPSVLTDWAGYAGFAVPEVPCQLVPVTLSQRGLAIDREDAFKKVSRAARNPANPARRKRDGAVFVRKFGVNGVGELLKDLLRPETFTSCREFSWTVEMVWKTGHTLKGDFYQEVYESYVRPSAH